MGQRASDTTAVTFEDVLVPKEVIHRPTIGKLFIHTFLWLFIEYLHAPYISRN